MISKLFLNLFDSNFPVHCLKSSDYNSILIYAVQKAFKRNEGADEDEDDEDRDVELTFFLNIHGGDGIWSLPTVDELNEYFERVKEVIDSHKKKTAKKDS